MPKIFISYSRVDKNFVQQLYIKLENNYGAGTVWYDKDIPGGADFWDKIQAEIQNADIFLYLMSADSLDSEWCNKEFDEAVAQNKVIIPIIVRARTPIVKKVQHLNVLDMSSGANDPDMLTKLYSSLNPYIYAGEPPPQPPQPKPSRSGAFRISPILIVLLLLGGIGIAVGAYVINQQNNIPPISLAYEFLVDTSDTMGELYKGKPRIRIVRDAINGIIDSPGISTRDTWRALRTTGGWACDETELVISGNDVSPQDFMNAFPNRPNGYDNSFAAGLNELHEDLNQDIPRQSDIRVAILFLGSLDSGDCPDFRIADQLNLLRDKGISATSCMFFLVDDDEEFRNFKRALESEGFSCVHNVDDPRAIANIAINTIQDLILREQGLVEDLTPVTPDDPMRFSMTLTPTEPPQEVTSPPTFTPIPTEGPTQEAIVFVGTVEGQSIASTVVVDEDTVIIGISEDGQQFQVERANGDIEMVDVADLPIGISTAVPLPTSTVGATSTPTLTLTATLTPVTIETVELQETQSTTLNPETVGEIGLTVDTVQILNDMNYFRVREGHVPLVPNTILNAIAERHANDLTARDTNVGEVFVRSDGTVIDDWITELGYPEYANAVEVQSSYLPDATVIITREERNITPDNFVDVWLQDDFASYHNQMNRPFLDRMYREVGISYKQISGTGTRYYVIVFASQPNALPVIINPTLTGTNITTDQLLREVRSLDWSTVNSRDITLLLSNEYTFPNGNGGAVGEIVYTKISEANEDVTCPTTPNPPEGWEFYQPQINFTLSQGLGLKTIYIYMCDEIGNQIINVKEVTVTDEDINIFEQSTPPTPSTPIVTASTFALDIRSGPGLEFSIINQLNAGDSLEVIGISEQGTWLQVVLITGSTGWVSNSDVTLQGDIDSIPIVAEPTPTPTVTPSATPQLTSVIQEPLLLRYDGRSILFANRSTLTDITIDDFVFTKFVVNTDGQATQADSFRMSDFTGVPSPLSSGSCLQIWDSNQFSRPASNNSLADGICDVDPFWRTSPDIFWADETEDAYLEVSLNGLDVLMTCPISRLGSRVENRCVIDLPRGEFIPMPYIADFEADNSLAGWVFNPFAWPIDTRGESRALSGDATLSAPIIVQGDESPEWLNTSDMVLSFRANLGINNGLRLIFNFDESRGYHVLELLDGSLTFRRNSIDAISIVDRTNERVLNRETLPLQPDEWNSYKLWIEGRRIYIYVNNDLVATVEDLIAPTLGGGDILFQTISNVNPTLIDNLIIQKAEPYSSHFDIPSLGSISGTWTSSNLSLITSGTEINDDQYIELQGESTFVPIAPVYENFELSCRIWSEQGGYEIRLRESETGSVRLLAEAGELSATVITPEDTFSISQVIPNFYTRGLWQDLTIIAIDDQIRIYLDGELQYQGTDNVIPSEGTISFIANEGDIFRLDDCLVTAVPNPFE